MSQNYTFVTLNHGFCRVCTVLFSLIDLGIVPKKKELIFSYSSRFYSLSVYQAQHLHSRVKTNYVYDCYDFSFIRSSIRKGVCRRRVLAYFVTFRHYVILSEYKVNKIVQLNVCFIKKDAPQNIKRLDDKNKRR